MAVHRSWFKGLSAFGGFKVKGSGFLSLKDKGERLKAKGYSGLIFYNSALKADLQSNHAKKGIK